MSEKQNLPSVAANQGGALVPKDIEECKTLAHAVAWAAMGKMDQKVYSQALIKIAMGAEIGMAPIQATRLIHAIPQSQSQGGGVNFTLSAEAMRALVMRSEQCLDFAVDVEGSGESLRAVARGERVDMRLGEPRVRKMTRTVTYESCKTIMQGKHGIKANWKNFPERMLIARASGNLCRDLWPDVIMGVMTTEEWNDQPPERKVEGTDRPARRRPDPEPEAKPDVGAGEVEEAQVVDEGGGDPEPAETEPADETEVAPDRKPEPQPAAQQQQRHHTHPSQEEIDRSWEDM